MNGVHDMGGMQGFGPVVIEQDEPLYHADWERRVVGMRRALGPYRIYNVDESRKEIERMPPARYLSASYYERWLYSMEANLVAKGVLTRAEIDARVASLERDPSQPLPAPGDAATAAAALAQLPATPEPVPAPAQRFRPGDRVQAHNVHPAGHTRLARYVRGRCGTVERVLGVFPLPDAYTQGQGVQPQTVYAVAFDARELWGDSAEPNSRVSIDLWESYLEPAGTAATGE